MATTKVTTDNFNISSSWRCKKTFKYHGTQNYGYYVYSFAAGPSCNTATKTFRWSVPSGAKIKKAQIWANISIGWTGASVLTANDNPFNQSNGSAKGANVSISGNGGTLTVVFKFKANGNKADTNTHYSTTQFTNVYLLIEYEGGSGGDPQPTPPKLKGLEVPPQSVAIYDPSDGKIYMFDGVVKIQHALSMKIEEEPEKHKEQYTNNARNEPDKLTLDVVMSDVYDGSGAIVNARGFTDAERTAHDATKKSLMTIDAPRSENAFYVLRDLKEARKKLCVITPQFVHTDMILASVTVNQDEEHTHGWEGQIVFQHTYKAPEPKKNNSTPSKPTTTPPSPSTGILSNLVNGVTNFASNLWNTLTGKKK